MTTSMEQVSDAGNWMDTTQHDLVASLNSVRSDRSHMMTRDLPRGDRTALLASIVEAQILPRLARARWAPAIAGVKIPQSGVALETTNGDTLELVRLLLTEEAAGAVAFIDVLRAREIPPDALYLGVVTLAARRLGELWEQDVCDFVQVTISMGRLQQVVRALSPHFQARSLRRPQEESVLLAPAPGEQHTFGLGMLAEFFQRAGWRLAGGPMTTAKDAADIARNVWIDVVGFSIGSAAKLEGLARCIQTVRRASQNPDLFVMVGGPLLLTQPDLVIQVGADTSAADAVAAVRKANELVSMRVATD